MDLAAPARLAPAAARLRLRVRGQVQGVGFRPTVHRLAHAAGLAGWVRNDAEGVLIEIQGAAAEVEAFAATLRSQAPPLARIGAIETEALAPHAAAAGFAIRTTEAAHAGPVRTAVTPDTAPCEACVAEMMDPGNRRWRHAFINCTHCGPRDTLTHRLPYDRASTSMAVFTLCGECAREYADPADRRFHAQPNACAHCGPRLTLLGADGGELAGDALAQALRCLREGGILALKAAGGYQLLCDARQGDAVARLRARKDRDHKPFAVMVANLASARMLAQVDDAAAAWLTAASRPIVLCPGRVAGQGDDTALPGVAPGLANLGLMLPSTPLHLLLWHTAAGAPPGTHWLRGAQDLALVVTSANPAGEPIVRDDDQALQRLAGLADAWLMHDRAIVARADDSVLRALTPQRALFVRRSRGFVPEPIELASDGPAVLAFGADLKNTVCLTRGREAWVSPHVGGLDNAATRRAQHETVQRWCRLLEVAPQAVAHDLHPDFASTTAAQAFAAAHKLPALAVQHHHAHAASVWAEALGAGRVDVGSPVLALVLDGHGHGSDGGAWGGELLRLDGAHCTRLAHLATLPLAGGDRAAREPWRVAAAVLHGLGRGAQIAARFGDQSGAVQLGALLASPRLAPPTSSAGRWFDAAAALAGVHPVVQHEAQAAMRYEALAEDHGPVGALDGGWCIEPDGQLSLWPLMAALADLADPGDAGAAAALFHATLAAALVDWVAQAARREDLADVMLAGGCMLNAVLVRALGAGLRARGLRVHQARSLPPGDGGLCLGQAWVLRRSLEP